jgi:hypothetical protein
MAARRYACPLLSSAPARATGPRRVAARSRPRGRAGGRALPIVTRPVRGLLAPSGIGTCERPRTAPSGDSTSDIERLARQGSPDTGRSVGRFATFPVRHIRYAAGRRPPHVLGRAFGDTRRPSERRRQAFELLDVAVVEPELDDCLKLGRSHGCFPPSCPSAAPIPGRSPRRVVDIRNEGIPSELPSFVHEVASQRSSRVTSRARSCFAIADVA